MSEPLEFPADFTFGVATSAYQVEGSPLADGAGVSNWHRFAHTPGRMHGGATGDFACDHYRRFRDDEFLVPRELTQGKSSVRVRVKFTPVKRSLFPGQQRASSFLASSIRFSRCRV